MAWVKTQTTLGDGAQVLIGRNRVKRQAVDVWQYDCRVCGTDTVCW